MCWNMWGGRSRCSPGNILVFHPLTFFSPIDTRDRRSFYYLTIPNDTLGSVKMMLLTPRKKKRFYRSNGKPFYPFYFVITPYYSCITHTLGILVDSEIDLKIEQPDQPSGWSTRNGNTRVFINTTLSTESRTDYQQDVINIDHCWYFVSQLG